MSDPTQNYGDPRDPRITETAPRVVASSPEVVVTTHHSHDAGLRPASSPTMGTAAPVNPVSRYVPIPSMGWVWGLIGAALLVWLLALVFFGDRDGPNDGAGPAVEPAAEGEAVSEEAVTEDADG